MSSRPSTIPAGPHGAAVVTGASRRIGRAIALELARAGFGLTLTYRSRAEECAETAAACIAAASAAGHSIAVSVHRLDLADTAAAERFARDLSAAAGDGGAVDVLVHNASNYGQLAFGSIVAADLEAAYRIEVVSPLLVTQALAGALGRSGLPGGAAVVLFSDIHALGRARTGFTPYLLAKATVDSLARQLAVELAPRTRVHCIAPGVVLWPDGVDEATKQAILARTPLGRTGTPGETARLVRFLALEGASMTGETIYLDGGRSLR